jgi:hypothetical protein
MEASMRRLLGLLCAATAATTLLFALNEEPALANTVHCGDLITQDTTLTADLYCPGSSGLSIEGDEVTLDLGGHAIVGSGVGNGIRASLGAFTIRDGTVSGFEYGIVLGKADAYVTRIAAAGNGFGFFAHHSRVFFDQDIALRNQFDGFYTVTTANDAVDATYLRNRADSNGGLGINAPGQTDAGKNHAHKNGDPRQCVGVVCKP